MSTFQLSRTSWATGTSSSTSKPFFGGSRGFSICICASLLSRREACNIFLIGTGKGFFLFFGCNSGRSTFCGCCSYFSCFFLEVPGEYSQQVLLSFQPIWCGWDPTWTCKQKRTSVKYIYWDHSTKPQRLWEIDEAHCMNAYMVVFEI